MSHLQLTTYGDVSPSTFEMDFDAQVPTHIRRAGRESKDGVHLSMAQWYPKMAEYDFQGWQDHAYIAREFQGVWGDFDVTIHIDPAYTVGGTGMLQNNHEIGHGYEDAGVKVKKHKKKKKLAWHFKAEMYTILHGLQMMIIPMTYYKWKMVQPYTSCTKEMSL